LNKCDLDAIANKLKAIGWSANKLNEQADCLEEEWKGKCEDEKDCN